MNFPDPVSQMVVASPREATAVVPAADINCTSSSSSTVTGLPPFHYLISEQAKSILALQELQNEVGALLEFRDLVMEAFPHLRQKLALSPSSSSRSASSTTTGIRWEPGVRVKRKLGQQQQQQQQHQQQSSKEQETPLAPSLVPRCRSNSHGGGKVSKSGEGNISAASSAVQDSGFCAESKEHSGSSTASSGRKQKEMEDELWSLLDVIYQRGTRLRLDVEYLRNKLNREQNSCQPFERERRKCRSLDNLVTADELNRTVEEQAVSRRMSVLESEINDLKKERSMLLDKISDMEGEHVANLSQTNNLLMELETINTEKRDLEEQLRIAITSKCELNSKIHDLHSQFVSRSQHSRTSVNSLSKFRPQFLRHSQSQSPDSSSQTLVTAGAVSSEARFTPVSSHCTATARLQQNIHGHSDKTEDYFTASPLEKDSIILSSIELDRSNMYVETDVARLQQRRPVNPLSKKLNSERYSSPSNATAAPTVATSTSGKRLSFCKTTLGSLDGVITTPSSVMKIPKGCALPQEKVLAVLNEFNPVELQRHLLTNAFQNEALSHELDQLTKSRTCAMQQLRKCKEENEDLKFQLEEKGIQLEGTRAQLRMMEKVQSAKLSSSAPDVALVSQHTLIPSNPILPHLTLPINSNSALIIDDCGGGVSPSANSSTESSHRRDLEENSANLCSDNSEKTAPALSCKKPSKIPLKSYSAPKPPVRVGGGSSSYRSTATIIRNLRDNTGRELHQQQSSVSLSGKNNNRNEFMSRNWDSSKNSDLSITKNLSKDTGRSCSGFSAIAVCNSNGRESLKAQDIVAPGTVYKGVRKYSFAAGMESAGSGNYSSISPTRLNNRERDRERAAGIRNSPKKLIHPQGRVSPVRETIVTVDRVPSTDIEPKKYRTRRLYGNRCKRRGSLEKPPSILPAVDELQEPETGILMDVSPKQPQLIQENDKRYADTHSVSTDTGHSETVTCDEEYFDSIETESNNTVSSSGLTRISSLCTSSVYDVTD